MQAQQVARKVRRNHENRMVRNQLQVHLQFLLKQWKIWWRNSDINTTGIQPETITTVFGTLLMNSTSGLIRNHEDGRTDQPYLLHF